MWKTLWKRLKNPIVLAFVISTAPFFRQMILFVYAYFIQIYTVGSSSDVKNAIALSIESREFPQSEFLPAFL